MQLIAQPTVAVFGGSFNPVHEGHVAIARALAAHDQITAVAVVPARQSPFKHASALLPADVRWAMLRQALRGLPGVFLSDLELRRPGPSYTVDTMRALAAQLPQARLAFALGWDALADFATWHRAAEILSLAGLLGFDRAGHPAPPDPNQWARLLPPPWDERALARDRHLATADGRVLLRHLPLALPAVAARDILGERALDAVPPGAREVLASYWQRTGAR